MEDKLAKPSLETFIEEMKKLNLSVENADLELRKEKFSTDDILYSKLEIALKKLATWMPFFQHQIDLSKESGHGTLASKENVPENSPNHYYLLNAREIEDKKRYRIRLIEHTLVPSFGPERFKVQMEFYHRYGDYVTYFTVTKKDIYVLADNVQFRDFVKNIQAFSRDNAEKTLNLFIIAPFLFKKATQELHESQQKRIGEIQEQKKRISEKEIPETDL